MLSWCTRAVRFRALWSTVGYYVNSISRKPPFWLCVLTGHDTTWHCTTWKGKTRHDKTWHCITEQDMTWHDTTGHAMPWHDPPPCSEVHPRACVFYCTNILIWILRACSAVSNQGIICSWVTCPQASTAAEGREAGHRHVLFLFVRGALSYAEIGGRVQHAENIESV